MSDALTAGFVYNGDGVRVKSTIAGVTTVYIGSYYEWTGSTATAKKYYYASGQRIAVRTGSTTLNWLLGDHLGSTALTADSAGNKLAELRYKAWGENRYTSGTTPTTFKYSAQREDAGLGGVMFYNARWYDPTVGRFLQADTIVPRAGDPQAYNRYSYTRNNPINRTDPTGHCDGQPGGTSCQEAYEDLDYETRHRVFESVYGLDNPVFELFELIPGVHRAELLGWSIWRIVLSHDKFQAAVDATQIVAENIESGMFAMATGGDLAPSVGINIDDFSPVSPMKGSSSTGFSGVYDPRSGRILLRPSGSTTHKNGNPASGLVAQYGGHAAVNAEMAELNGANTSQTVGFSVAYHTEKELTVGWNSGTINLPNYGDRAAPIQFRDPIMETLQMAFPGFNVLSR